MKALFDWFPWASLWPFAVAVAGWWCLAYGVGLAVRVIKFFRGGAFALLLLLPVVVRADDPTMYCSNCSYQNTYPWDYYPTSPSSWAMPYLCMCYQSVQWCNYCNCNSGSCVDWNEHYGSYGDWTHYESVCSCNHVFADGSDCLCCTGVFTHSYPPPDPPPDEGYDVGVWPLIIGFGSGLGAIGCLFSLRLIWRSINSGLDVYDRD